MDPLDIFISELLKNLDAQIDLNNQGQILMKFLDTHYGFINPDKKINVAVYCFECEYLTTK